MPVRLSRRLCVVLFALTTCPASVFGLEPQGAVPAATLPGISGLARIGSDLLAAVHDAKNPTQLDQPRVSLIWLPKSSRGLMWKPLALEWPSGQGPGSDLESVAGIPGTQSVLLVESGGDRPAGFEPFNRIFLADFAEQRARIVAFAPWPVPATNVEGTAVARVGNRLLFIFAERAEGEPSTTIRWSDLTLDPLGFGPFQGEPLSLPDPRGKQARQVSAMDVDAAGHLYVATTLDPGNDGPFQSVVWRIGRVEPGEDGAARVRLRPEPEFLARLDGLKVEALAIQETGPQLQLFVGTDDENYGGIVRLMPPVQ